MTKASTDSSINNYEIRNIFSDKLSHYSRNNPKYFLQLDAFFLPGGGDDVMRTDEDGDCLFANQTVELMHGATVRVLIPEGVDVRDALRQMKKITKLLKKNPDLMDYAKPPERQSEDHGKSGVPF